MRFMSDSPQRFVIFNGKTGVPFVCLGLLDGHGLDVSFQQSMQDDWNISDLGDLQSLMIQEFEPESRVLWICDAFVVFLETGKANMNVFSLLSFFYTAKEMVVGFDDSICDVLQDLGVQLVEPFVLILDLLDDTVKVILGHRRASFFVVVFASFQKKIIHFLSKVKLLLQTLALFACWIQSVFVCSRRILQCMECLVSIYSLSIGE